MYSGGSGGERVLLDEQQPSPRSLGVRGRGPVFHRDFYEARRGGSGGLAGLCSAGPLGLSCTPISPCSPPPAAIKMSLTS